MIDNTFIRRREIEWIILTKKKITMSELLTIFDVGRRALRRDMDVLSEYIPISTKKGRGGGYYLPESFYDNQDSLSEEELLFLIKMGKMVSEDEGKIILSIINKFAAKMTQ